MIKNVIFDIGMVLVDFAWKDHLIELGFDSECIDALDKSFINDPLWDELDLGIMKEEDVIDSAVARLPQYESQIRLMWDKMINAVRPYDYSKKWIMDLKEKGLNTYLLSNYPDSLFKKSVECAFPFYPYIDGEVVSSRVKLRKPDERIYKTLFEKYNLVPEECVFFDDRKINIDAAKKLGVNAFLFEGYEKACKTLDEICK